MNRVPFVQLPAHAAVRALPDLYAVAADELSFQAAVVAPVLRRWLPRPALLSVLEKAIAASPGGLVTLEGPAGSGVTSTLIALAAAAPRPTWLEPYRPLQGAAALYAQIIAVRPHLLPLINPAAITDATVLERVLALAAPDADGERLVLIVDLSRSVSDPAAALLPPLPRVLPPGVTLVIGCEADAPLPMKPIACVRLPDDDPELAQFCGALIGALDLGDAIRQPICDAAAGSPLYLKLASTLLRDDQSAYVPQGLVALIDYWWDGLPSVERRLAQLLAVAGAAVPLGLLTSLSDCEIEPIVQAWEALGLLNLAIQRGDEVDEPVVMAEFVHGAIGWRVVQRDPAAAAAAHLAFASVGRTVMARRGIAPAARYLVDQFARHVAGAKGAGWQLGGDVLSGIERVQARERHDGAAAAYQDAAWAVYCATAHGTLLQLAGAAAQLGTLATLARQLSPDAAVAALIEGIERGNREAALRQVLDLVEQLPDGSDKAQILRRLGETCYTNRMRSSAMRLLSRAIDLEAQPVSRAWRDQREQLLAALALATLSHDDVDGSLVIAERIEHLERRAQVETQVARRLLEAGDRDRAQRVARAMLHESMSQWARAEVAVALCRADDPRGALMMNELTSETVLAWAQIELACDAAASDEAAALARIQALASQNQRDRGLARLAHTLASLNKDGDALAAAEQIHAVEVRVAALIDLRLNLDGLVAMLALERAVNDIAAITGDDRGPLISALAAALASLGKLDRALALVEGLEEGEERNRGLARVAVALAQGGQREPANEVLSRVDDIDESDWARDEIARQFGAAGFWDDALHLVREIESPEQRARTTADLAIMRARAGHGQPALGMVLTIEVPAERLRALMLIIPALVAEGQITAVTAIGEQLDVLSDAEGRSRYLSTLAVALADAGEYDNAVQAAARTLRPLDRARAEIALAGAYVENRLPEGAQRALGRAFSSAGVGREECYRALEVAAPVLAALGGSSFMRELAILIESVDRR